MTDETMSENVVAEPTVDDVVKELRTASLEDLKRLPEIRKANAVPFKLPGTDLQVKIAPCTMLDSYKSGVAALQSAKLDDGSPEKLEHQQIQARAMLKACVVEPVLDDEAIEALEGYSANGLAALLFECQRISALGGVLDTDVAEDFS